MYPLLFELPLPAWLPPVSVWLWLCGAVGLALAVLGQRRGERVLLGVGLAMVVLGVGGAQGTLDLALPSRLSLTTYGVLLSAALGAGWMLVARLGSRDGMSREALATASFAAALGGVLGARLDYLLQTAPPHRGWLDALDLNAGGLSWQGALLGGAVASAGVLYRRRLSWLGWADVTAPALALGLALGRCGSYAQGGAFGLPLGDDAPRLLRRLGTFPRWDAGQLAGRGSPAWVEHVNRGLVDVTDPSSLPTHPVALYLAAAGLALFIVTLRVRRRRRFVGEVFLTFVFAEAVTRFTIELLRDDPDRWLLGPRLPVVHALGLVLVTAAAAFAMGPARALRVDRVRWRAQSLASVAALAVWAGLAWAVVAPFAVVLSLGQWGALAAVCLAALAWVPLSRHR